MVTKTVIGLEIHVQLKTKSKMFCRCDNNAENAAPNILVCPICMGMPGTLPVANKTAIEWTLKTGLALNCQVAHFAKFDRKHYFYPDLPKGYQISQYDMPFCKKGFLEIDVTGQLKKIGIRRVHLEEDAGKLVHPEGKNYSLVDLNRAGTPLMEIVTEPEINSPQEAKIFIQELRSILRYLDVSDADMEKGQLRCDANISIMEIKDSHPERSEGSPENAGSETSSEIPRQARNDILGTPVEIKNMNSFRMVERALSYEEKRQKEEIAAGRKIVKETRGWDDSKGITISQRGKEYAQDYRYFPEPDLPPFKPHQLYDLEKIKKDLPELPAHKRRRYIEKMNLPLQDAAVLTIDKNMAIYFERVAQVVTPKIAANWIINELKSQGILVVKPEDLADLLVRQEKSEISGKIAKEIFAEMVFSGKKPGQIIKDKGIKVIGDEAEINQIVDGVIKENPSTIQDYKKGKTAALGFLVGQVMKKTAGQVNPQMVNKILKDKLESLS